MSEIPLYRGTEHPDDWMRQVQTKCLLQNLRNDRDILKAAKLNIAASINGGLPAEINSVSELIKALKEHNSFAIFKNDCKQKLEQMIFEGGDTAKFIADFRSLITKAEITNPDDVRSRLLKTYATNDFFRNEFGKRTTGVTDIDDLYKLFANVISDDSKIIRFGPDCLIFIKHVATGFYLSSGAEKYQGGSQRQVVFSDTKARSEESEWYLKCENPISKESYQEGRVFYDDIVYLTHKQTGFTLNLSDFYKSPVTEGGAEVHCFEYAFANFHFIKTGNLNNQTPYVKAKDTLYMKLENDFILRSHNVKFSVAGKSFFEVIGHKEEVNRNDEWQIEMK